MLRKTILAICAAACLAGPARSQGSLAQYNARLRRINRLSGKDWYELGQWCRTRMLWLHASDAFQKSMALDPRYRARCLYQLADMAYGRRRDAEAAKWIEAARKEAPDDPKIAKLYERITHRTAAAKSEVLEALKSAYKAKKYKQFLDKLIAYAGKPADHGLRAHEKELAEALGGDPYKILVKCRLNSPCPRCGEGGFHRCPACLGKGYRMSTRVRRILSSHEGLVKNVRGRFLKPCPKCDGLGAVKCEKCKGAALYLVSIYDGEKTLLAKALAKRASELLAKLNKSKRSKKRKDIVEQYRLAVKVNAMYAMALSLDKAAVSEDQKRLKRDISRAKSKLKRAKSRLDKEVEARLKDLAEKRGVQFVKQDEDEKKK